MTMMTFLKKIFGRETKVKGEFKTHDNCDTEQIANNIFVHHIPKEEIETWDNRRRQKDKVERFVDKDGFHMIEDGRSGTIYYSGSKRMCEIYFELSGVKQYDILVAIDQLNEWFLPEKKLLTADEKKNIEDKLKDWLRRKRIKTDLTEMGSRQQKL